MNEPREEKTCADCGQVMNPDAINERCYDCRRDREVFGDAVANIPYDEIPCATCGKDIKVDDHMRARGHGAGLTWHHSACLQESPEEHQRSLEYLRAWRDREAGAGEVKATWHHSACWNESGEVINDRQCTTCLAVFSSRIGHKCTPLTPYERRALAEAVTTPKERALAEAITMPEGRPWNETSSSPYAEMYNDARASKAPRCFDCGGMHAEGECVATKIENAATRAAGALTDHEHAAIRWLAHCATPPSIVAPAIVAAIAGLFERAATRLEALAATIEPEPGAWWEPLSNARGHHPGPTIALRCRNCSASWFMVPKDIPERCPAIRCKFAGGEVTS